MRCVESTRDSRFGPNRAKSGQAASVGREFRKDEGFTPRLRRPARYPRGKQSIPRAATSEPSPVSGSYRAASPPVDGLEAHPRSLLGLLEPGRTEVSQLIAGGRPAEFSRVGCLAAPAGHTHLSAETLARIAAFGAHLTLTTKVVSGG